MNMFKKAERTQSRLRIALFGPSGSGKTLSALILAASIARYEAQKRGEKGFGRVAVIDTENGRASLYVGHESLPKGFTFDRVSIKAPFDPLKYCKYIEGAAGMGAGADTKYDVVVVDSVSHAWAGRGGMLDQKDQASGGSGNNFTAWKKVSKQHQRLVDALVQTDIHVVVTCRTKTAYELVDDPSTGRKSVKKIGTAPVFREGLEYEFLLCWELDMDHVAQPTKDNTSMFDTPEGKICEVISELHGNRLVNWLYEHVGDGGELDSEDSDDQTEEEHSSESDIAEGTEDATENMDSGEELESESPSKAQRSKKPTPVDKIDSVFG